MKLCRMCNETKTLEHFARDKSKKDGLNAYCRPCAVAKQAALLLKPNARNDAKDGMKYCQRCKETKPVAEFSNSTKTFDKLDRRCKTCNYELHNAWRLKNLDHAKEQQKAWRDANPQRVKDFERRRSYGVPPGWYAETLAAQGGGCAACGTAVPGGRGDFHVDHCHDSGKVRGLLCANCNLAVGHVRNNPEIAEALKQYIIRTKQ